MHDGKEQPLTQPVWGREICQRRGRGQRERNGLYKLRGKEVIKKGNLLLLQEMRNNK